MYNLNNSYLSKIYTCDSSKILRDPNCLRISYRNKLRNALVPLKLGDEVEEFKRSCEFMMVENCVLCAERIVRDTDSKFDLDSEESCLSARRFLTQLEHLAKQVGVAHNDRSYRKQFSNSYRILYSDDSMSYLTEIIDSAQESYPYLWVNGEKYVFSADVLDAGRDLFLGFCEVKYLIQNLYSRVICGMYYKSKADILFDLARMILNFDDAYVSYEKLYVFELMIIEADARRYVTELTDLEKDLIKLEIKERACKSQGLQSHTQYEAMRKKYIQILNYINSVVNYEGKGRDDLDEGILLQAETLCQYEQNETYRPAIALAKQVKQVFYDIRLLVRKYDTNLELVDPQLANNRELVELMEEFELVWEKGKTYISTPAAVRRLTQFAGAVECMKQHRRFLVALETMDSSVFFTIPAVLVLYALADTQGVMKGWVLPATADCTVRQLWCSLQKDYQQLAQRADTKCVKGVIEEYLINDAPVTESYLIKITNDIKSLGVYVQRHDPSEWNKLLNIVIGI